MNSYDSLRSNKYSRATVARIGPYGKSNNDYKKAEPFKFKKEIAQTYP